MKRKGYRIIALFLALFLVLDSIPFQAAAAGTWSGEAAEAAPAGSGTAADPYQQTT